MPDGNFPNAEYQRMGDPEIETRIAQYELAYRMQASVPDVMDISREPASMSRPVGTRPRSPARSPTT